jgi:SHS2 domain-containing protein
MKSGYRILEHTADIGFEAFGQTREEALANGTTALLSIITDPDAVSPTDERDIEINADDWEQLAVRYLNEVLYLVDAESFLPSRVQLRCKSGYVLTARLYGETRNERHEMRTDVKAVTYHQLRFTEAADGYRLRVFVDI